MKTNYQAYVVVLNPYKEHTNEIRRGIINDRERLLIEKEFNLAEKDLIQLQDARDFVVASSMLDISNIEGDQAEQRRWFLQDMMSAITFVIDCVKLNRGGEV